MKTLYALFICVFLAQVVYAQGIGVNETGADPHPSAILDVSSSSKGLLPPRMTTAERDEIQNPAEGLHIYNLTTKCVEVFYGTFWQSIHCGCSIAPSDLVYTDNGPITYCLNQSIPLNSPATQGGNPSSYTVSPSPPAGLFLNTTTGQITGSPTAEIAASNYTVSASNACGSTTRILNIGVIAIPAVPSTITGPSAPTINLSADYSIDAVSGAISYTWTVPVGWTINSGQGTTSVDVAVGANSGNVSVTASNACGTSSASTKPVSVWRPVVATGGTIANYIADGTNGVDGVQYRVHNFTTVGNSTFDVADVGTDGLADYLIVGGGGGGGGSHAGGGGGAGGVRNGSMQLTVQGHAITVGNGGIAGSQTNNPTSGQNSSALGIVSNGGGAGGQESQFPGQNGGSGGGGSGDQISTNRLAGSGQTLQGNSGGTGSNNVSNNYGLGGGGGGASSAGGNATSNQGGNGGNGLVSSISGVSLTYAGGGGGGGWGNEGRPGGSGGSGGGGNGGSSNGAGQNGQNGRGAGGGGSDASAQSVSRIGGSGGSGIVTIRYPITNPNP